MRPVTLSPHPFPAGAPVVPIERPLRARDPSAPRQRDQEGAAGEGDGAVERGQEGPGEGRLVPQAPEDLAVDPRGLAGGGDAEPADEVVQTSELPVQLEEGTF